MSDPLPKTAIDMAMSSLRWDEGEIGEARAIQGCLRHLLREAYELRLNMTAQVLVAAMDAVDLDLDRRRN